MVQYLCARQSDFPRCLSSVGVQRHFAARNQTFNFKLSVHRTDGHTAAKGNLLCNLAIDQKEAAAPGAAAETAKADPRVRIEAAAHT